MSIDEYFPVVSPQGDILRRASRKECHNNSFLLHPVVHLHILHPHKNAILLQKRAPWKDIQPGMWDTAVGGHVDFGESVLHALHREAREELNIRSFSAKFIRQYLFTSSRESELIHVFCTHDLVTPQVDRREVDEVSYWRFDDIMLNVRKGIFTPNFEHEFLNIITQNHATDF